MTDSSTPGPAATAASDLDDVPLAEVFDLAPSFLAVLRGPDHVFERVNQSYLQLVGDRELIGLPVREALAEVVEQGFVEILNRVYRTGEPFTASEFPVRLRRGKDGRGEERFVTFVYQSLGRPDDETRGIVVHGMDMTQQVRSRQEVEVRESRFRSLIENSHDKITVLSGDDTILFESPACERLLGWTEAETVGRSALEFIHPDDRERVTACFVTTRATPGAPVRFEHRMLHRDGSWRHFETVSQAGGPGQGDEVVMNSRDITERRTQEVELQTLIGLMPQLVWATTAEGYHDFFNERWYEYTGMERGGGQGWNWKDYLHPDDYERTLEIWHHSLATGEPYEIEYRFRRARDGAYRWFIGRAHPLRGPDGEIMRWFGTCTDVHDERTALEAAELSQERFRAATNATNDVVWDWDLASDRLWWNDNASAVLGFDPDPDGSAFDEWSRRVHSDDRDRVVAGLTAALEADGDVWSDEYRFVRDDGSTAYFLDRGRMLRDAAGAPTRMIGSITDLTERHRLEEELRQAQKMEAIGRLAGGVAHDFNNLLTVITNVSAMLLEDLGDDQGAREDVTEISRAASRAAALTRQLLAFGRRQVLQPRDIDLNAVVDDTQRMLSRVLGEHITLLFDQDRSIRTVHADPGQIEQVIVNLALNARDAMPHGGVLTLQTANVQVGPRRAREAGVTAGPYVQLCIRDTGIGMDEQTRSRALEPFFTTKPAGEGTGLGLSTVHGIITQSGGFVELDSERGSGTVVCVFLPAQSRTDAEPTTPESSAGSAARSTETVLLVEDEAAVRSVARRALSRHGYTVIEAEDGRAALGVLGQRLEEVDLLITDLVMPIMGGSELATRARQVGFTSPILFMSGYADSEMQPQRSAGEQSEFLEKPFSMDQLLAAAATALSRGATRP